MGRYMYIARGKHHLSMHLDQSWPASHFILIQLTEHFIDINLVKIKKLYNYRYFCIKYYTCITINANHINQLSQPHKRITFLHLYYHD